MTDDNLNTTFWPRTFQERGVTVPFTTPALAYSRVRAEDEEYLELLVPGMAGNNGVYVIPWEALEEVFRMSIHDRELHEEIEKELAATPEAIRKVSLGVSELGLAGPENKRIARQAIEQNENEGLLASYFLINKFVDEFAQGRISLSLDVLNSADGQVQVRGAISDVAEELGMDSDELYSRLEAWGAVISPVGIPGTPHKARMRAMLHRLRAYCGDLEEWAADAPPELAELAELAARIGNRTEMIVSDQFSVIDQFTQDLGKNLRNWRKVKPELQKGVSKCEWLLNGWDHVISIWQTTVAEGERPDMGRLQEMTRVIPLVPKQELEESQKQTWADLEKDMQRNIRSGHDWITGKMDLELMLRLEKNKANSL